MWAVVGHYRMRMGIRRTKGVCVCARITYVVFVTDMMWHAKSVQKGACVWEVAN